MSISHPYLQVLYERDQPRTLKNGMLLNGIPHEYIELPPSVAELSQAGQLKWAKHEAEKHFAWMQWKHDGVYVLGAVTGYRYHKSPTEIHDISIGDLT